MVAKLREDVTGPLRKIEAALRTVGRRGREESKGFQANLHGVHEQLKKIADVAKEGVAPAIEGIGISSLTAVGAFAALTASLKSFVSSGADVAAFGRKVQLTTDTVRSLEGAAGEFHVDPTGVRQSLQQFSDAMFAIRRHQGAFTKLVGQRNELAQQLAATPETIGGNEQALKLFLNALADIKRVHGEPDARMYSREIFGSEDFVDMLRNGTAGLDAAREAYLRLAGSQDPKAAEQWEKNWNRFTAAIEGFRNEVGNELLPSLTELTRQAELYFSEHKYEIAQHMTEAFHEMGDAMLAVNADVQAVGGWEVIFKALIALKLSGLALRIANVAKSLGLLVGLGTPPGWILALIGGTAAAATADTFSRLAGAPTSYDPMMAGTGTNPLANLGRQRFIARLHRPSPSWLGMSGDDWRAAAEGPASMRNLSAKAAAVIQGLRDRGLDAAHAAIMAGNIEQESGFDPSKPNYKEGGIGLIQWRLDRRAALDAFVASRRAAETSGPAQLDFLMQELRDTPAGRAFLSAQSLTAMNRALHEHIRYGDDSEAARFANGLKWLPVAASTAPSTPVAGNVSVDVNVNAPRGTSVKASADGLFNRVNVNRGLVNPSSVN